MEEVHGSCDRCNQEDILDPVQRVCWNCWCLIGEAHEMEETPHNEEE